ncbi:hypothetical protein L7F22_000493 [Adiantum nelumboides]|nr:hypothetical protein [Adiantum nelumboides]
MLALRLQIQVHKVDRACSPRVLNEHSMLPQSLPEQHFLHEVCSSEPFPYKGTEKMDHRYCQSEPQEKACTMSHHKGMPSSATESVCHELWGSTVCKIDHDLIGFHRKKKSISMHNTVGLAEEQLDYLNSLDARLRSLETCATLQASNKLDNGVADKANTPQDYQKVDQRYNNTRCTPTKILLVQLVAAKDQVVVDNINVRVQDTTKVLSP